jgi:broad specificity phosphatase PhoE
MNIYIVRHGQTNYNALGLCNDNPMRGVYLTEQGIKQAERTAKHLAFDPIDIIFVSQLPRTRQTARFINTYHKVRICEREELNDIRTGFDGRPLDDYLAYVGNDRLNKVPPGGESLFQFKNRVNMFIDSLLKEHYENVLIVAHEETMRVFAARFNGLSDKEMEKLKFLNCELLVFRLTNQLKYIA